MGESVHDYAAILERFVGLRPLGSGKGWKARCPAHDDHNPSLNLWIGPEGELRAQCMARRCPWPEIVRGSGTEAKDWFPGDRLVGEQRKITKTYDYRDAAGKLLYQVVRFEPKGFAVRRPRDMPGAMQWEWGLGNVAPTLYRLPDLLARPTQPVIVVEGEKDADALWKLGLAATTNSGGAGRWLPEFSPHLAGRRVAVIPDNDGPGLSHAADVAGCLMFAGLVTSIRIVRLPASLPEKADVSDWLATCADKPDGAVKLRLIDMIKAAPEWGILNQPPAREAAPARAA